MIAVFCLVSMLPLALMMRRRLPPNVDPASPVAAAANATLGLPPNGLTALLSFARSAAASRWRRRKCISSPIAAILVMAPRAAPRCCPSCWRLASSAACWPARLRIGSAAFVPVLIGSVLQAFLCCSIFWFNGLDSLYIVSALFGLFLGGIIPIMR